MRRRSLQWAAGIALCLFSGVAFANHYASQADKFFQNQCSKRRQSGIEAFVCDLRERLDNIQIVPGPAGPPGPRGGTGATGPQGVPGSPGASRQLNIFAADGTQLGPFVDANTFFYEPDGRLAQVDYNLSRLGRVGQPLSFAPYFPSGDCIGPGSYPLGDEQMLTAVNTLFSEGRNRHFVVDRGTPVVNFQDAWQLRYDEDSQQTVCVGTGSVANLRALRRVQLPFNDPVGMPLRFAVN